MIYIIKRTVEQVFEIEADSIEDVKLKIEYARYHEQLISETIEPEPPIGVLLRKARHKRNMTLEDVKYYCPEFSKDYLKKLEQGTMKLNPHTLYKLCEVYGLDYKQYCIKAGFIVKNP